MISRDKMPQIPKDKIPEFRKYCAFEYDPQHGISSEECRIPSGKLKPIQQHINREKVEKMKADHEKENDSWQPLLVSKEGYILDGHHRWVAQKELDPTANVPCILFKGSIKDLIKVGHKFEHSFTKSVHEQTIYKEYAKILFL